jgi:hypothetical protein
MTHDDRKLRSTSPDRAIATDRSDRGLLTLPGTKWRSVLGALAAAPLRLHRYRNFHTEVIEDAIRAYDRGRCT